MKEKPIIFSSPMVRAILEGRKTQTRRVVDWDQPHCWEPAAQDAGDMSVWHWRQQSSPPTIVMRRCHYGAPSDRLWVRETWQDGNGGMYYAADNAHPGPWKSPMFMPRWASRITLEVVSVWVERLQQISEEDANAEGVASVAEFAALWDSIHDDHQWYTQPWVWVVAFKPIDNNNPANADGGAD